MNRIPPQFTQNHISENFACKRHTLNYVQGQNRINCEPVDELRQRVGPYLRSQFGSLRLPLLPWLIVGRHRIPHTLCIRVIGSWTRGCWLALPHRLFPILNCKLIGLFLKLPLNFGCARSLIG
jgi:hypothetical protein